MTALRKPVRREVENGRRALVVSLEPPDVLAFREKGRRQTYRLGLRRLYYLAVKEEAQAARELRERRAP